MNIQYVTKRIIIEGEALTRLKSLGFSGMWRQLNGLAATEATDVFVPMTLRNGYTAEHFTGVSGFFRKLLESAKISWAKWTGHVDTLIARTQKGAQKFHLKAEELLSSPKAAAEVASQPSISVQPVKTANEIISNHKVEPEILANALNQQLKSIPASDIEALIKAFPATDQPLAALCLKRIAQYSKMEDFNIMLTQALEHGQKIYVPTDSSLAANLYYMLAKKGQGKFIHPLSGIIQQIPKEAWTTEITQNAVVLVDDVMLHRLKTDLPFRELVRSHHVTLLHPESFENGINAFTDLNLKSARDKVSDTLNRAKHYLQSGQAKTADEALSMVLNGDTTQTLKALGLHNQLKVIQNPTVDFSNLSAQAISERLNEKGITATQVSERLHTKMHLANTPTPEIVSQQLQLLSQEAKVYSGHHLGEKCQQMHQLVLEQAKAKMINPQDIYYLVPTEHKSYGLMSMIYRQANGISPERIVYGLSQIPKDKKALLVVVDDFCGSGASLSHLKNSLDQALKAGEQQIEVAYAPLVSLQGNDMEGKLLTIDTIPPLHLSPTFQSLSEHNSRQQLFESVLGGSENYNPNALKNVAITFPHMAPDNTCNLFRGLCQPFTLNQCGMQGVSEGTFISAKKLL